MTRAIERREVALVDLLDRVLAGGVVIAGEITLTIADIDLVRISLRALIASVRVENEGEERGGREEVRHDG
ncbi:gas vesicle protein [Streptomyces violaceusniger]|uniref:gas vesicle protein n=1 Tax=Streptomyces violaceusniger TaxID=68280 RepID=UPI003432CF87